MESLSQGLVADVLLRLHREAEAVDAPLMQAMGETTDQQGAISHFIESETRDLAGVYRGLADNFLNVSPEEMIGATL